jgi:cytochrome c553
MKKTLLLIALSIVVFSCQKKEEKPANETKKEVKETDSTVGKEFEMYSMSEMAALMEQMYVQNSTVKEKISKGESIGEFPEYYLKIHSASFTDESDNDLFFKTNAKLYIEAQKTLYSDSKNLKEDYNAGVDACIKCHEKKCGGPIPRIKKLYLK